MAGYVDVPAKMQGTWFIWTLLLTWFIYPPVMHDIQIKRIGYGALTLLTCLGFLFTAIDAMASKPVPTPSNKPLITDVAQHVKRSTTIPVPAKKPDFSKPAIEHLLSFGQTPVPAKKPLGKAGSPLNDNDALTYRKIFGYQSIAQWDRANDMLGKLGDFRLRGHILFQRYMHPTSYRASFTELEGWMSSYADHPGATKIYKLALSRMPDDYKGSIRKPVKSTGVNGYLNILSERGKTYHSTKKRNKAQQTTIRQLEKSIRKDIARGNPTKAYKRLLNNKSAKLLDSTEYDKLRAQIANSYMMAGKMKQAKDLSMDSAHRAATKVPLAGWVGGLVNWQEGHYKKAASLFELTATSPYSSNWTAAAGAYWAARAHTRAGNIKQVSMWLRRAADHPRTFYGLIATRTLGWDFDFNWNMPEYTAEHKNSLKKHPAGQRAMLLVHAGQYHLAEKELRQINPKNLKNELLSYANYAGLPSYSMRLAAAVTTKEGALYDAALYPLSPWKPQNGYKVDRALIYALIRQESRFNPTAENPSGATGLMQLMPTTANFVSKRHDYRSREGRHNLKNPQLNLDIGQRYVESLLRQNHVNTELFSLVMAYNAGPGNLRKWKKAYSNMQNDPLLFIESIPMSETRNFVERVMANYWIYRMRMGQDVPSLIAVTEGDWARYVQLDGTTKQATISKKRTPYLIANKSN